MIKRKNIAIEDLKHIDNNFDVIHAEQESERDAFLNNEANKEAVLKAKVNMEIAKEVYNLCKKAHLTQAQVAQRLNIKQPTYARIEKGQNVSVFKLFEIAKVCGAEVKINFHMHRAKYT